MPKPIILGQIARKHLKPGALVRQAASKKDGDRVSVFARVEVPPDLPTQAARDFKMDSKPIREGGELFVATLLAAAQMPSALAARAESNDDGLVAIADQVRVYTLYEQQSVRDLRTKRSSTQPKKVLGGALDEFLLAYLEMGAR